MAKGNIGGGSKVYGFGYTTIGQKAAKVVHTHHVLRPWGVERTYNTKKYGWVQHPTRLFALRREADTYKSLWLKRVSPL